MNTLPVPTWFHRQDEIDENVFYKTPFCAPVISLRTETTDFYTLYPTAWPYRQIVINVKAQDVSEVVFLRLYWSWGAPSHVMINVDKNVKILGLEVGLVAQPVTFVLNAPHTKVLYTNRTALSPLTLTGTVKNLYVYDCVRWSELNINISGTLIVKHANLEHLQHLAADTIIIAKAECDRHGEHRSAYSQVLPKCKKLILNQGYKSIVDFGTIPPNMEVIVSDTVLYGYIVAELPCSIRGLRALAFKQYSSFTLLKQMFPHLVPSSIPDAVLEQHFLRMTRSEWHHVGPTATGEYFGSLADWQKFLHTLRLERKAQINAKTKSKTKKTAKKVAVKRTKKSQKATAEIQLQNAA